MRGSATPHLRRSNSITARGLGPREGRLDAAISQIAACTPETPLDRGVLLGTRKRSQKIIRPITATGPKAIMATVDDHWRARTPRRWMPAWNRQSGTGDCVHLSVAGVRMDCREVHPWRVVADVSGLAKADASGRELLPRTRQSGARVIPALPGYGVDGYARAAEGHRETWHRMQRHAKPVTKFQHLLRQATWRHRLGRTESTSSAGK